MASVASSRRLLSVAHSAHRASASGFLRPAPRLLSFADPARANKYEVRRLQPSIWQTLNWLLFSSNYVYVPLILLGSILVEKAIRDFWDWVFYERNKGALREDVIFEAARLRALEEAEEGEEEEEEEEE
eukprot:TRINITY_DN1559_c5_g1_i1.p1 TRINITY_DN1559_c5_g1~~TRINITY_DN1559_c5_g1_i1.p1  ORF type:complete len:129 (+),score=23.27 TRINITY_DN1559_c5_g1_i1:99-485(+)